MDQELTISAAIEEILQSDVGSGVTVLMMYINNFQLMAIFVLY